MAHPGADVNTPRLRIALQALAREIDAIERHCHDLGFTITAAALNNAKNAAGWEASGDLTSAAKAARGERPDE